MKKGNQSKKNWEKHWGKKATIERLKNIDTSYKEVVDYLLSITTPKSKCIEIGCGSGIYSLKLIKNKRHCLATDISAKALELTKIKGKQLYGLDVKTKLVDIYQIPYPDNHFDLVFSDGVIEHLDIPQTIAELKRVTKKGGYVVTKVPSGLLLYKIIYILTSSVENRPDETWYPRHQWKIIFKKAGFKNVRAELCGSVLEGILNRLTKNEKIKNLVPKIGKIYFLIKCQK